jgi:hypothetical protein
VRGALLAAIALIALGASACGYADPYSAGGPIANESPLPAAAPTPTPGADNFSDGAGLPVITYPDGLQYVDIKVGTGKVVEMNLTLTVEYTGWLSDGKLFDTSRGREPFTFQLSQGNVIAGWDEGLLGMKVGGKRKLTIPSDLAYGPNGQQDPNTGAQVIPPDATLVFEVEMTKVAPAPKPSPTPKVTPTPTPSPSPSPST